MNKTEKASLFKKLVTLVLTVSLVTPLLIPTFATPFYAYEGLVEAEVVDVYNEDVLDIEFELFFPELDLQFPPFELPSPEFGLPFPEFGLPFPEFELQFPETEPYVYYIYVEEITLLPDSTQFSDYSATIPKTSVYDFPTESVFEIDSTVRARFGEWQQSFVGFLTFQGEVQLLETLAVFPGEIMQVELEVPHLPDINYNMMLVEIDLFGNLSQVETSQYETFINPNNRTLYESVSVVNDTNFVRFFGLIFVAVQGSSTTVPYIAHISINTAIDSFGSRGNNAARALPIVLPASTGVWSRTLETSSANHWISFEVPSSRTFVDLNIQLDTASRSLGHTVGLYQFVNGQARAIPINEIGYVTNIQTGRYFLRVSANGFPVTGAAYRLYLRPFTPPPTLVQVLSMRGQDFHPGLNYGHGIRPRIRAGHPLTITGRATRNGMSAANATIEVRITNEGWRNWNASLYQQTARATTNSFGNFTIVVHLHSGRGEHSFRNAALSTHFFDMGYVDVYSPYNINQTRVRERVYILAWTL
ncbi:MAG: hypothetical protein FWG63_12885 [Defluviitaleaceae bacterium]|nr:hypothetical protein [Defluviitaleaceae bacterium]